jgi:hypothetical protein
MRFRDLGKEIGRSSAFCGMVTVLPTSGSGYE